MHPREEGLRPNLTNTIAYHPRTWLRAEVAVSQRQFDCWFGWHCTPQGRFEAIRGTLLPYLKTVGFKESALQWLPASGPLGENLVNPPHVGLRESLPALHIILLSILVLVFYFVPLPATNGTVLAHMYGYAAVLDCSPSSP